MQTSTATTPNTNDNTTVDAKITADLNVLKEKMELCETMLRPLDGSPAPSLKNNETMLTVVGFLEACAPRMVQLVEVGAQGNAGMSESVLMECLSVNDALQKLLADVETLAETETTASTTAASAPTSSVEDDLDDLLLDDGPAAKPAPASGGKTTGDDDPFGNEVLTPSAAESKQPAEAKPAAADPFGNDLLSPTTSAPAATKPTAADHFANESLTAAPAPATDTSATDDFDSFLAERTTK